ncbi:hypothetical protein [Sulfoacidibacillus thermotolerans]|uniref:Uncharacterized protein n=1 Tax=Sulfoacidibacillus thermotolerans TaxID=1765684 RepID=A0A2U3D8Z1_SULT2|nr:hypothetical protein [Sulfoacidibacillus thermotolerans]PWI57735.1 hypothetical protein BM613_07040 [Sulfoacidibacillus thermotolerans]
MIRFIHDEREGSDDSYAKLAVPPGGNEHWIPLFYAMGAAEDQRAAVRRYQSYQYGNLSDSIWQFG